MRGGREEGTPSPIACQLILTNTCDGDGQRDIDGGQQPQEDDGEESAHREEDEDAAAVHDGADKEEEAEDGADAEQRHGGRPSDALQLLHAEHKR